MVWWSTRQIGRTRRFVGVQPAGSIRRDGWAAAASPNRPASGGEETGRKHGAAWDGSRRNAFHFSALHLLMLIARLRAPPAPAWRALRGWKGAYHDRRGAFWWRQATNPASRGSQSSAFARQGIRHGEYLLRRWPKKRDGGPHGAGNLGNVSQDPDRRGRLVRCCLGLCGALPSAGKPRVRSD